VNGTSSAGQLMAIGTVAVCCGGADTVIYTDGSAVNINVTISAGAMPNYTVAATLERLL